MTLSHERRGGGPALLLLHGIGQRRQIWDPVLDLLAAHRDVVAVDLPGFGASAPLPPGEVPTPERLAASVVELAGELGLSSWAVAGISLGGLVALELGAAGSADAVVAISPAGLWGPAGPTRWSRTTLTVLHSAARRLGDRPERVIRGPVTRTLAGGVNYGRPWALRNDVLAADAVALAGAPGWDATRAALDRARFTGGAALAGRPATVAWGSRDLVLPRRWVHTDLLPAGTRFLGLPGCGHTPTYDEPGLVTSVVLTGTAT